MNDQAKIMLRRMFMLRALEVGADPRRVGAEIGLTPKQVSNCLSGLVKLGLVDVEQQEPVPGTPPYIKARHVHSLSEVGASTMRKLGAMS